MAYAIHVHKYGGPEVLQWEPAALAEPAPGEVRLRQHAVGLNYIDVYLRTGLYPQPKFPFVPGMEGAGEVIKMGAAVKDLKVGDRVDGGKVAAIGEQELRYVKNGRNLVLALPKEG